MISRTISSLESARGKGSQRDRTFVDERHLPLSFNSVNTVQKSHRALLWLSVGLLLLTAAVHSMSLIVAPSPHNETERQLLELMSNYKLDLGGGYHRSMSQLMTALSSCFTLLFVLGALINITLLRKKARADIVKAMVGVQSIVFGVCFVIMLALTFLPPIILSGAVFVLLLASYLVILKTPAA